MNHRKVVGMFSRVGLFPLVLISAFSLSAAAQQVCPARPAPGDPISNPLDLYSQNGTLTLNLDLRSEVGSTGFTHYCYVYMNNGVAVEAPTLRLNPGDRLVMNFTNNIPRRERRQSRATLPSSRWRWGTPTRPWLTAILAWAAW